MKNRPLELSKFMRMSTSNMQTRPFLIFTRSDKPDEVHKSGYSVRVSIKRKTSEGNQFHGIVMNSIGFVIKS